jgi:D-glycero-D-manno-heptose 1,7-bisphosphate phosphatase
MSLKRAVFFDRDDTLILNIPYNGDPSKVQLMPGVKDSLKLLSEAGFLLFLASNQSGVGRGMITVEQVEAVNETMHQLIGDNFFEGDYMCFAAPGQAGGENRKPSPYMLQQAAKDFDLDLTSSFMVGDRLSDMQCGKNAHCKCVLVPTVSYEDEIVEAKALADFVAKDLLEAAQWILSEMGK